jgi:preprotein translocase subunit SecE
MGAELFHVDGRMDMTKLIVAFRNFAKAPKNESKKTQWNGLD